MSLLAAQLPSSDFIALKGVSSTKKNNGNANLAGQHYWYATSGQDLQRLMEEAGYSKEAQARFLNFFRETICTNLGDKPGPESLRTAVGWDGNPFEYSLEFAESTKKAGVRFVVDLSPVRTKSNTKPLSADPTRLVIDSLRMQTPMFDDAWHRSLEEWFTYDHLPVATQEQMVKKAGYQSSVILGFDINPKILEIDPTFLPVMAKDYYPPNFVGQAKDLDNWQALSGAIENLPGISQFPNITKALHLIEEYLSEHPNYKDGARGLSTDFVKPGKARLKIYMRYSQDDFEEIWDYYTLGGRIPGMEIDKDKFRDLMAFSYGSQYNGNRVYDSQRQVLFDTKPTAIYFSLSPDKPYPIPKIYFYPARHAQNDEAIAQGIDHWLEKYGWLDSGDSVESKISRVFSHRPLKDNKGIFTFVGLGRKEKQGLSLQVYVTGELYQNRRLD